MSDPISALTALGFTPLEAAIYSFLLQESPATGYRIAQAIGKPFANTYQAISSLQSKGAVLVHEGDSKLCRAVPALEVLGHLKRTFFKHRSEAMKALSGLTGLSSDFGVYQLRFRAQIMERFRMMLKHCKEIAICTIFPRVIEEVKSDLEAAAERGVRIAVTVYEPVTIKAVDVVLDPRHHEVLERWPGQWLNAVMDGKEHLIALLSDDGASVHHALWSGNVYLSWIYHSAVSTALIGTVLSKHVEEGASHKVLREQLRHFRKFLAGGGYQTLTTQFFPGAARARKSVRK